jgi:hypothetical protein
MIFVSAGMNSPKKADNAIARRNRYLNYGLLSLANSEMVQEASVYHGHFDPPSEVLGRIIQDHLEVNDAVFLVSCPSYFALDWARDFARLLRSALPASTILFGGRWVVGGNVPELGKMIPEVDKFVEGLAELQLPSLLNRSFRLPYQRSDQATLGYEKHGVSFLDYSKLNRAHEFVPSFEASRGCGAGCTFCAEADVKLTPLKPPELLCAEILSYRSAVKNAVSRYYLEASNFTPRVDWLRELRERRQEVGIEDVYWRTEARVDIFSEQSVQEAYRAGLRVLDLGLESASHLQLQRMRKTKSPAIYLERASKLVSLAHDAGISIKLNILLYPGETIETISDTLDWLRRRSHQISGVSVYPAVHYGSPDNDHQLLAYYKSLGASIVEPNRSFGINPINLSPSICYPDSEVMAREISREFMTDEQYFKLKSFTYFDPAYTREAFYSDVLKTDLASLSFSTKRVKTN